MIWEFLSRPGFQRLALALVHFLWQGAAIAGVAALLLHAFRRKSSQTRYVLCAAALIALTIAPLITFCVIDSPAPAVKPAARHDAIAGRDTPNPTLLRETPPAESRPHADPEPATAATSAAVTESTADSATSAIAPYLIACWLLGVACFGGRLLFGFAGLKRLARDRTRAPEPVTELLASLSRRLRLSLTPTVACSRRVSEAMVVGFVRPVILLPAAWALHMPPGILQSVLAHELVHIRRRDQWVNLLQRIAEVLLFYHPAVWWISGRMRTEREFCCDELASGAAGGVVRYAEALELVGRLRADTQTPLLSTTIGGTNMALLSRVKNLLGKPGSPKGRDGWMIGLLAICIPLMICVSAAWWPSARADEPAAARDDGDQKGDKKRDNERERTGNNENRERKEDERGADNERRERSDRERAERRKREERKERGERREGDRPKGERDRRREGDRPRGERDRPREGDRPRRDGDRPRGDRPRDRERPRREGRPDRERPPREGADRATRRERPLSPEIRELLTLVKQLRSDVARLRRDVDALKRQRGGDFQPRRDGDAGARPPRRERDRPRGDRERPPRRDGDPTRKADRPRRDGDPLRNTDRPRRDG